MAFWLFIISTSTKLAVALYAERRGEIRVVIMDMMMPTMDGAASIKALRKIDPTVRVIAVSGSKDNVKLIEIIGTDVDAFLSKPYTAETLLRTLQQTLPSNN